MSQPYLASARYDLSLIIAPAFLVTLIALLAAPWAESLSAFPVWLWAVLIIGVDVSHVWSTLFRTYLDQDEMRQRPALYQLTPLAVLLLGAGLYSLDAMVFWRALAYLALFHFVRQQYGFMMLYARHQQGPKWLDKAAIYGATLVPLIYWHCHGRSFNWFIDGDFVTGRVPFFSEVAVIAYIGVLIAYGLREWRTRWFNLPKNLLLLGTILSWGVGIIVFDNDIIFTATNVVAHGVPYLALTWIYGRHQRRLQGRKSSLRPPMLSRLFTPAFTILFLVGLIALAFLEEGLWDRLIWNDNADLFQILAGIKPVANPDILVWLVPLLALPQATHYVLDAFIWRADGNVEAFKRTLFLADTSLRMARHDP